MERVHDDGFVSNDGIEVLVDLHTNLPTTYAYELGTMEGATLAAGLSMPPSPPPKDDDEAGVSRQLE